MICNNCEAVNEETSRYCFNCGALLTDAIPEKSGQDSSPNQLPSLSSTPIPSSPSTPPPPRPKRGLRNKDLLKDKITPANGEVSVRTYYCTYYLSRLLGLEASGYLGVTNLRVIFQALGTSSAGRSVIQSEIPIADVSGISSYKGTYFSFGHLAAAFFASGISASIFSMLTTVIVGVGGFLTNLAISGNASGSMPLLQIVGWIIGIGGILFSFSIKRHSIWRSILAAIAASGFGVAGGGSLLSNASRTFLNSYSNNANIGSAGLASFAFFLGFLASIYTLFCVVWYARRPTFSLAISSKGGSDTPINISGASGIGLFSVSAGKALTAEPAKDAELMLQELGAVILDIQILGDMGIDKWKVF